jgi:TolB-like protein
MVEKTTNLIRIDLNQFKLHLYLKPDVELTLHFNSPSRRFYLSVIGLVVHEMKNRGKIMSISLQKHLDVLELLNETVGGAAGSSKKEHLLPRIYRKWKDALPDLENAPLFKVVGRKKRYDELMGSVYGFSEGEKDSWANLFEYKGSDENVRLKFSVDRLGASLDNVVIIDREGPGPSNFDVWEGFINRLKKERENKSKTENAHQSLEAPGLQTPRSEKKAWPALNRQLVIALFTLTGFVLLIGALVVWKYDVFAPPVYVSDNEVQSSSLNSKPSIAVLPFRNFSDDPKQEYFSYGICDDLITDLSKIPDILVISSLSSFTYKDKSVKIEEVAKELDVQYILEGSVQKEDNNVRINAQLIDAETGYHLWAERYDGNFNDIFAFQDSITRKIAASLEVKLTETEKNRLAQKETDNIEAYEAYLIGSDLSNRLRFDPEGLAESIPWFEKAIALDPNYSRAYAALAEAYWRGSSTEKFRKQLGISRRLALMRRTNFLQIAMKNATNIAHRNLARLYVDQYLHEKALDEGLKALALEPNDPTSNGFMAATLIYSGRQDEASKYIERMRRTDPACVF